MDWNTPVALTLWRSITAHMRLVYLSLVLGTSVCSHSQVSGPTRLNDLRGRVRPILIFAPRPEDPRLQIQLRTLEQHAAEARDRDIVPIALPYNSPGPTQTQLTTADAELARRRFHVAPQDFVIVLIGNDGGEKMRASEPFSMNKLEETIDAMPMRRDEMRRKDR